MTSIWRQEILDVIDYERNAVMQYKLYIQIIWNDLERIVKISAAEWVSHPCKASPSKVLDNATQYVDAVHRFEIL